jgi:hypothetical protein
LTTGGRRRETWSRASAGAAVHRAVPSSNTGQLTSSVSSKLRVRDDGTLIRKRPSAATS